MAYRKPYQREDYRKLYPRELQVYRLVLQQGHPVEDVALALGTTVNAVMVAVGKVRRKLKLPGAAQGAAIPHRAEVSSAVYALKRAARAA